MRRVTATLAGAARSDAGPTGPMFLSSEGDVDIPVAALRNAAEIQIEFHSGSARPVVGPVVRFAKRLVRRALRWYVKPIMEQQTRFNHALLDAVETLRLRLEAANHQLADLRDEIVIGSVNADQEGRGSRRGTESDR